MTGAVPAMLVTMAIVFFAFVCGQVAWDLEDRGQRYRLATDEEEEDEKEEKIWSVIKISETFVVDGNDEARRVKKPRQRPYHSVVYIELYGEHALKAADNDARTNGNGTQISEPEPSTEDELERAARCGKWGPTRPSELFLRGSRVKEATYTMTPYALSIRTLSGPCMALISEKMPDIVRHMSNVIVRAEREVFLATNYWQNSVASKYITNAIRELDRRAGARGVRIVLKILYDRGSPRQLYEPHYHVSPKEFTGDKVNLPHPSEIQNIDMEVMNFHTPLMGTFHAKYMVVDRKIALLQSSNIQDNDNLETLIHLEGPVVDSLYDMALISWHKRMEPPLPSYDSPAALGWLSSFDGTSNGAPRAQAANGADERNPSLSALNSLGMSKPLPEHTADDPQYDDDIAGEVARSQASLAPKPGLTHLQAVARLLNHTVNEGLPGDPNAPECPPGELMTPYIPHQSRTPYPMALVNRAPYGPPTHRSVSTPQNAAWLSALNNAKHTVYIISPTLNASPLIPAIIAACERGVNVYCYICLSYNDAGELLPRQGGHNEKVASTLYASLSSPSARARLHYHWYVAKDQTRPIPQSRRQRSSHVKLMIVDGAVAIQGNGNQDTQSWFHSQEVNVMIDSEELCAEWLAALRRNQNMEMFGRQLVRPVISKPGRLHLKVDKLVDRDAVDQSAPTEAPGLLVALVTEVFGLVGDGGSSSAGDGVRSRRRMEFRGLMAPSTIARARGGGCCVDGVQGYPKLRGLSCCLALVLLPPLSKVQP
ncbi:hypothetical protein N657DRAFT_670433 [Parathielavia appendiculata]|uniref:PLD phosphodiesterase domain-containing protein n=1 Tax=Parathielavia appendiculata TaxID=2587402 RepID=A0AAN6U4M9_9PEZI|nr:hypothetical protein N657DRAFT_670433 [Parathielavia appendiculata]